MKIAGKKKGIILIITLWIIVVLLIIGVAMADMSLSSLFYVGYYSQKQQAMDLADCGVKEAVGRIIANNSYGTSSEELPDTATSPDVYKNKLYFLSFKQSGATIPSWLPSSKFQYSYNNLGSTSAYTIAAAGRVIPPGAIYLVSYAKTGNTIVKVESIVSTQTSSGDPLTIGGADTVRIESTNDIDINSADSSTIPTIWSNLNISPAVTLLGSKISLHGGIAGSNNPTGPDYGVSSSKPVTKSGGVQKIPPIVNIASLDTDGSAPTIPSGSFVENGSKYDFYEDPNSTPADVTDDVLTYKITSSGVCDASGTPVSDPVLKNSMKYEGGKLSINTNIRVRGNMVFLKGDGINIKDGAYIYLENYNSQTGTADTTRWSDYYSAIGNPSACSNGANVTDTTVKDHPDKLDPVNPAAIPVSPYVDKPMYGNLSMFDGALTGKGSIYSQGAVTINAKDPIVFTSGKQGIAIIARGDINVSSKNLVAKFTGLLYSHEDILSNVAGKDLIATGAFITSGGSTYGDSSVSGKGKLEVKSKKFKLTFDPSYLKALQGFTGGGTSTNFTVRSWIVDTI